MIEITILKDTNEIQTFDSNLGHYIVYGYGQKDKFLADVQDAEKYVNDIDWLVKPNAIVLENL